MTLRVWWIYEKSTIPACGEVDKSPCSASDSSSVVTLKAPWIMLPVGDGGMGEEAPCGGLTWLMVDGSVLYGSKQLFGSRQLQNCSYHIIKGLCCRGSINNRSWLLVFPSAAAKVGRHLSIPMSAEAGRQSNYKSSIVLVQVLIVKGGK